MERIKKHNLFLCVILAAVIMAVAALSTMILNPHGEELPKGFRPIESASNLGQNAAFSIGFETYGGLTPSNKLEGFYQIITPGVTEKSGFTDKIFFKLLDKEELVDLTYLLSQNLVDNTGTQHAVKYFDNVEIYNGSLCFNSYGNHLIPGVIEAIKFEQGFTLYDQSGNVLGQPLTHSYEFTRELDLGTVWVNKAKVAETDAVSVISNLTNSTDIMPNVTVDLSGLVFGVKYDNDTVEPYFPAIKDIVSPANGIFTEGGDQQIEFNIFGQTISIDVKVKNLIIQSIEFETQPSVNQYDLGEEIDLTDVFISAKFNEGEPQTVQVTEDMLAAYDNLTVGVKDITLNYMGKSLSFQAEFIDKHPENYFEPVEGACSEQHGALWIPIKGFGTLEKDSETDPFKFANGLHSIDLSKYCNADTHILLKLKGESEYKTIAQLKEEGKVSHLSLFRYGIGIYHLFDHAALNSWVEAIKFLPGFRMVTYTEDTFVAGGGSANLYTPIEGGILRKEYEFKKTADERNWEKVKKLAEEDPVVAGGEDTIYAVTNLEVQLKDLKFTIKYDDGTTDEYIPSVDDIIEPVGGIFTEGGQQSLIFMIKGVEIEIFVNVIDKRVDSIELLNQPAKNEYNLGELIDLTNVTVKVTFKDGATENMQVTQSMLEYDPYTVDEQKKVTIKIGEGTAEFTVKYVDPNPEQGISPDAASWFISGESWKYYPDEIVCLSMGGQGMPNLAAYAWVDLVNNTDTHLSFKLVDVAGIDSEKFYTAGELKAINGADGKPLFTRLNTFGNTLLFIFNDEIKPENVYQVKLHEGFFMVKGPGNSNIWDNTVGSPAENEEQTNSTEFNTSDTLKNAVLSQLKPEASLIVKRDIIMENNSNRNWVRAFAEENPYEIISMPTKTDYKVGDEVSLAGMQIRVNYLDGGTEIIEPNANNINKPLGGKIKEAGEQNVTITVNGQQIEFKISVSGNTDGGDDGDIDWGDSETSGGCSNAVATNAGLYCFALLAAFGVTLVILKKRQRK